METYPFSTRLTTSQCRCITAVRLRRELYFFKGGRAGVLEWHDAYGRPTAAISVYSSMTPGDEHVRLVYDRVVSFSGRTYSLDYAIKLTPSKCNFGGVRWWFLCPMAKNGKPCNRRVGALYLGGENHFGCRHCYNLTYESSRDSHKYDRFLNYGPLRQFIESHKPRNKYE